jgi:YD repeat-containing protein
LIAKIDETQTITRYSYDHANRLVALGADKETGLVQYRYQGRQLIEVIDTIDGNPEHATERTRYQYNGLGAVIQETRWIARGDAASQTQGFKISAAADKRTLPSPGLKFTTATGYDEAGRVVNRILPDGHRLTYRYTAAEAGRGKSRPGQLAAILFDDKIVITDIEQTQAGGLAGYTTGNGIRSEFANIQGCICKRSQHCGSQRKN